MKQILKDLIIKAKNSRSRILFPETEDIRTLKALEKIQALRLCHPVLIGEFSELQKRISKLKLKIDLFQCEIISAKDAALQKKFSQKLFQIRAQKGMSLEKAAQLVKKDINYFATMCIALDMADGMVSGATSSTGSTLLPAFQVIRTAKTHRIASGVFLMVFKNRPPILFADCAVNVRPSADELADIAINTAETAAFLGFKPRVALLSFSSHGSSTHPEALKIAAAAKIIKRRAPKLIMDGELQVDSALVPSVAHFKAPQSKIQGDANILIFPSLEAGNIGYKLVERLAEAEAIGTIVQGLAKPVNDLSRGCKPSDIVYLTAVTALQIKKQK